MAWTKRRISNIDLAVRQAARLGRNSENHWPMFAAPVNVRRMRYLAGPKATDTAVAFSRKPRGLSLVPGTAAHRIDRYLHFHDGRTRRSGKASNFGAPLTNTAAGSASAGIRLWKSPQGQQSTAAKSYGTLCGSRKSKRSTRAAR
jgi:hypothetical protein